MEEIASYKKSAGRRFWEKFWPNALAFIVVAVWLIPIIWVIAASFSADPGYIFPNFFPTEYTFNNYVDLFTETDFLKWIGNTLIVAVCNTLLTTLFTIITAYVISRFRFRSRKLLMNLALILGMFPGFMSMIAIYFIFANLGMVNNIWALLIYYVAGAGLGYSVSKGYMDTIPYDIDEAAYMDGASKFRQFIQIFLPLAKPIIIYTALMAFMTPWSDYILASLLLTDSSTRTVAVGLYSWMDSTNINTYFTKFAAGSVLVSVPITALYIGLQKFFVAGISAGAVKG